MSGMGGAALTVENGVAPDGSLAPNAIGATSGRSGLEHIV